MICALGLGLILVSTDLSSLAGGADVTRQVAWHAKKPDEWGHSSLPGLANVLKHGAQYKLMVLVLKTKFLSPDSFHSEGKNRIWIMEIRGVALPASLQTLFPSPPNPLHLRPRVPTWRSRTSSVAHGLSGARMSATKHEPSLAVKDKASELSYNLKGTSIFLVGMNCTMKTNLGKFLADSLRYYYFDSDDLVKQTVGAESPVDPSQERDEDVFSNSETEVLKQLSSMGRLVVCAGDGAVQSVANLAYLRYGISLWVDVPVDLLANKILKDDLASPAVPGPLDSESSSKVLQELADRYNDMKGGYGTADATVSLQRLAIQLGYENLDSVTPEDMAVQALKEIEKLTRVKKMMEAAARPF